MKKSLLFAAFIALPIALNAAVLVTYSTNAPTGSLVSYPVPSGVTPATLSWRWTSENDRRDLAQAFIASSDFQLTSFTFYTPGASSSGGNTRPIAVIIEELIDGTLAGGRQVIETETGVLPSLGSGQRYVTFSFDSTILLEAGKTYGIRLSFTDDVATSTIAIATLDGVQPDLLMYAITYSSSSNPVKQSQNMAFWVGGTAIPEGSTVALIALGGIAIGALRKRGKLKREIV